MAFDVVRLLDHLKIKKAHIVGYSMGGFIVAKLLTMEPKRFLTATLGGSGAILAPTESQLKLFDQLGSDIDNGSIRTMILALTPKDQSPPTEEQMKMISASFFGTNDRAALAAEARSLPDLAVTEAEVAKIEVPTLAIVGTSDPMLELAQKLKSAMPRLNVITVENATHMNAQGRPEFVGALQEFLKANRIKK